MIDAADFLKWLEIFNVQFGSSLIPIPVPLSYGGTGANLTASTNSLVYSTSSALALLATNPSSVLVTSAGGVPSLSTTLPANLITTDPTLTQGIATKHYVDQTALTGTSVYAATTTNLTITQSGAGVGATITDASGTFAPLTLDSVVVPLGANFLYKDSAAPQHEGIYTLTTQGDGVSVNWQGTRATNYDTPSEINSTGLIIIRNGTTQAGEAWYNVTTIVTVDTTAFNYNEFGNIVFPISLNHGGTNAALTANNGGIFYSTATAGAILAGTATARQMLQSGASGAPAWSTTIWPATSTINQILFSSATNVISGISSLINGVMVTDNSGVPQFLANDAPGKVLTSNTGAPPSWQTLAFDGAITQVDADLGNGTPAGGILTISGGSTGLETSGSVSTVTLTGILNLASGGSNANLTANNGGIVYSTATAMDILAGTATAHQLLLSGASSAPTWSTTTYPTTNAINTLLYASSANVMSALATANSAGLLTNSSGVPAWVTATGTGAPVLGTSPTITTPKIVTAINDTNGNTVVGLTATASAVNYIQIANAATTFGPTITATGTDTNIPLSIAAKGTGSINFLGEGGSTTILSLQSTASAVNNFYMLNNATGLDPVFGASGSDSAVNLLFQAKGGVFKFEDGASTVSSAIRLYNAAATHYTGLTVATAQATSITFTLPAADGTNAALWSNGSGILSFGTFANANITSMTGLTGILQAPTSIASITGLPVLEFAYTASAVNHLYVQNGTTGVGPGKVALSVTGSDSAIPITISPKNSDLYLTDNTLTIAPALRFYNAAETHYSALKAATAQATDVTFTLPATDAATANTPLSSNASGVLSFSTTPFIGAATATSIQFGAGAVLDTYTTGTWTPALVSSGGGAATYNVQSGTYTRIGNRVCFELFLNMTGTGTLAAGSLTISGLPFTPGNYGGCGVTCGSLAATAITMIQCQIVGSSTSLSLFKYSAGTQTGLTVADLTATSQFIIGGTFTL